MGARTLYIFFSLSRLGFSIRRISTKCGPPFEVSVKVPHILLMTYGIVATPLIFIRLILHVTSSPLPHPGNGCSYDPYHKVITVSMGFPPNIIEALFLVAQIFPFSARRSLDLPPGQSDTLSFFRTFNRCFLSSQLLLSRNFCSPEKNQRDPFKNNRISLPL